MIAGLTYGRPFLLVLILLLVLGAAYALWSDVLKVSTEINTGEVDLKFGGVSLNDIESGKPWVANCSAVIVDHQDEEDFALGEGLLPGDFNAGSADGDNEIIINITNGYPGFGCRVNVVVENTGSVPVNVQLWVVFPGTTCEYDGDPYTLDCDLDDDGDLDLVILGSFNSTPINWGLTFPIAASPVGPFFIGQLDPGQVFDFVFEITISQGIQEQHKVMFDIVFIGGQWNEYP